MKVVNEKKKKLKWTDKKKIWNEHFVYFLPISTIPTEWWKRRLSMVETNKYKNWNSIDIYITRFITCYINFLDLRYIMETNEKKKSLN